MENENSAVRKPSLFGLITSPGEQFDRMRQRESSLLLPLVIVTLISAAASLIAFNALPAHFFEEQLTEDLIDLGVTVELLEVFGMIGAVLGGILLPIVTVLISSAVFKLIATGVSSDVKFKKLAVMNTFILLISYLGYLLNSVLRLYIEGDPQVPLTSLGFLIEGEGFVQALVLNIEVFNIWFLALVALGLHKVAGFSSKVAWLVAVLYFIFGVLMTLLSL